MSKLPHLVRFLWIATVVSAPSLGQHQFIPMPGEVPVTIPVLTTVSSDGTVLVGAAALGPDEIWRWEFGCDGDAIVLPTDPLLGAPIALAANQDGSRIAGSTPFPGVGVQAFLWSSDSGALPLGTLRSGSFSAAFGMTPSADKVVGVAGVSSGTEAFLWEPGVGMIGLGDAPGGLVGSTAYCISADGSVIGGKTTSDAGPEASVWSSASGWTVLGGLPGGAVQSEVLALNQDGSVATGSGSSGLSVQEAFRWTAATGVVGLGFLPGDTTSLPTGISHDGNAIVGGSTSPRASTAFLWTPGTGMVSLRDHLIANGATGLGGWELQQAVGISNDGTIVAGVGLLSGQQRFWIAVLGRAPSLEAMGTPYCSPASANSTGSAANLWALGSTVVGNDDARLIAEGLPPNEFALFLCSRVEDFVPGAGGGQGTLCLGGSIGRFDGLAGYGVVSTGGSGCATLAFSPGLIPTPRGLVSALPGQTWNFQAWYRDSNPNPTSNFTAGVSIRFQ